MIKSSWFYVKFKYAEKVSGYVLLPRGNLPPPSRLPPGAGLLWLRREADEPRNRDCGCFLRLPGSWLKHRLCADGLTLPPASGKASSGPSSIVQNPEKGIMKPHWQERPGGATSTKTISKKNIN